MNAAKRLLLAAGLLVGLLAVVLGQEPKAPPSPPPEPKAAPEAGQDASAPPRQAGAQADDEFIPTEELAPDAAITFPVDI